MLPPPVPLCILALRARPLLSATPRATHCLSIRQAFPSGNVLLAGPVKAMLALLASAVTDRLAGLTPYGMAARPETEISMFTSTTKTGRSITSWRRSAYGPVPMARCRLLRGMKGHRSCLMATTLRGVPNDRDVERELLLDWRCRWELGYWFLPGW